MNHSNNKELKIAGIHIILGIILKIHGIENHVIDLSRKIDKCYRIYWQFDVRARREVALDSLRKSKRNPLNPREPSNVKTSTWPPRLYMDSIFQYALDHV